MNLENGNPNFYTERIHHGAVTERISLHMGKSILCGFDVDGKSVVFRLPDGVYTDGTCLESLKHAFYEYRLRLEYDGRPCAFTLSVRDHGGACELSVTCKGDFTKISLHADT